MYIYLSYEQEFNVISASSDVSEHWSVLTQHLVS